MFGGQLRSISGIVGVLWNVCCVSPVLNGFGCFYGGVYIVVNGVLEQGCFDMYCISISVLHHSCIFQ